MFARTTKLVWQLKLNVRRIVILVSNVNIILLVFIQFVLTLKTQHLSGLVDYLQTEVSTSKQKKFPLVTFVDTPGLVDGDMNYPFDVNRALLWLGDLVDLIFVFFDPIGQVKHSFRGVGRLRKFFRKEAIL